MKQRNVYLEVRTPEPDHPGPSAKRQFIQRRYWPFDTLQDAKRWIVQHSEDYPAETEIHFVLHEFMPMCPDELVAERKARDEGKFVEEIIQEMEIWNLRENKNPGE